MVVINTYLSSPYRLDFAITDMIISTENDSHKFKNYLNQSGVNGAFGNMSFDKDGDLMHSEFILRNIKNGNPEKLKQKG